MLSASNLVDRASCPPGLQSARGCSVGPGREIPSDGWSRPGATRRTTRTVSSCFGDSGPFAWSATSPVVDCSSHRHRLALGLIALSAMARLAGQVLAINTVGALCLVLDVYALALLLGLGARARPVSPAWLAVVFAFSLPLERIVQRTIGYLLQQASAKGACGVLETLYNSVTCQGVRIVLAGKDVLVDLPCSGARALLLTLLAFAGVATVCRPTSLQAVTGFLITLASALAANILRITILAVGIAEPWRLGGIAVMEQPWHDLIGLATLALACTPLLAWARRVWRPRRSHCSTFGVPPGSFPTASPGTAGGSFR